MKVEIDSVLIAEWNGLGLTVVNTHTKQRIWLTPHHAQRLKEFLDEMIKRDNEQKVTRLIKP